MAEFLHMGGYAFFVWTSYAVVLALMVWHYVVPIRRVRSVLRELSMLDDDDVVREASR